MAAQPEVPEEEPMPNEPPMPHEPPMNEPPMNEPPMPQVLELRQYTLHPGRRDELIDLFERHFLDGQEACGMRVLGQFRDADDPDRFVWLRAFPDLPSRAPALASFYGGPLWRAHRNAANATMIDSDNVLLLRPVEPGAVATTARAGFFVATVYLLSRPATSGFARLFDERVRPLLVESGAPPIARLVTEYGANEFPQLPVRAEHAFVWLAAFDDEAAAERCLARVAASPAWRDVEPALRAELVAPPQRLRLSPTAHSRLGRGPGVGGLHDFDFLAGRWNVRSRRLAARGVGCRDWLEAPATCEARLALDGVANVDEFRCAAQGWSGMSVRAFDRGTRRWSIHWISGARGTVDPPVIGGFDGDRGEFHGVDADDGRAVAVRFVWTRDGAAAARWEQSFSYDGGATWESNWIMELSRVHD
ncbi:MAG TPA: NIPSNAP family protein [Polyangia bacterium]|nr:NIPSNAP family protein [Polyangia bacterium]